MKKMILLVALFLPTVSFANGKEAKVFVKGMVCGFCAQGIAKKFKAEPSVDKVDVSLELKTVTLDFKDGQDLADSRIETILKDSGYNVEKIDRTGK